jgi:hypothetical protein
LQSLSKTGRLILLSKTNDTVECNGTDQRKQAPWL